MTADVGTQRRSLLRGPLDRRTEERTRSDLIETLRRDVRTRVLLVRGDSLAVTSDRTLRSVPAAEIPRDARWAFLGRDIDGRGVLSAVLAPESGAPPTLWASFRAVAADASAADTSAAVSAISLGRWLVDSAYCPGCGSETEIIHGGWARRCGACARDLFPRTDPAVIVAVSSSNGHRLLLGRNVTWDSCRYSCFAGFVEAGESLEDTVVREVAEESGVRVADLRYVASQPWPFPRSLMVGFRAAAARDDDARPDGVEIAAVRWFTRAEIGEALRGTGDLALPGAPSLARTLIRLWHDGATP